MHLGLKVLVETIKEDRAVYEGVDLDDLRRFENKEGRVVGTMLDDDGLIAIDVKFDNGDIRRFSNLDLQASAMQ